MNKEIELLAMHVYFSKFTGKIRKHKLKYTH